jgi:hypothetical protein
LTVLYAGVVVAMDGRDVVSRTGPSVSFPNQHNNERNPMRQLKTLAVGATLALACIGAFAQATSTPNIDRREARQENRIQQGAASGQLTAHEALRLEKEQAAINRTEARAKADGTVTRRERKRLHRMQDHASRDIHKQKHDAQTARP